MIADNQTLFGLVLGPGPSVFVIGPEHPALGRHARRGVRSVEHGVRSLVSRRRIDAEIAVRLGRRLPLASGLPSAGRVEQAYKTHRTGLEKLELKVASSLGHRSGVLHGGSRARRLHDHRKASLRTLRQ